MLNVVAPQVLLKLVNDSPLCRFCTGRWPRLLERECSGVGTRSFSVFNVIKLFFFVNDAPKNKLVFAPKDFLQHSLSFAGKARSYPVGKVVVLLVNFRPG